MITAAITLDVHICNQRRAYRVTFAPGPKAEALAVAFIEKRSATHAFSEAEDAPFSYNEYPRLTECLYPTCEHGLSASLCSGPNHYGEPGDPGFH